MAQAQEHNGQHGPWPGFPWYELRHDYGSEVPDWTMRQRTLRPEERRALQAHCPDVLQSPRVFDKDFLQLPFSSFHWLYNSYEFYGLVSTPLLNFADVSRYVVAMHLDRQAQKLLDFRQKEPFPRPADLRVLALPGKTLFSCIVPVHPLCGILVRALYGKKGRAKGSPEPSDPLDLRVTFVRNAIAVIDAVFAGERLDPNQLRLALCQFGEIDADN